jgi:hypothetical protein
MGCGAALFNARVAIRALGRDVQVKRLPHPQYPFDVLAVLDAIPGTPPTRGELALHESIWRRRTNRGPFSDDRLPASVRADLVQAAAAEHGLLRMLNQAGAQEVLALADDAGRDLAADADHQAELRRWVGVDRRNGIPAEALPPTSVDAVSPVRHLDFLAVDSASGRRAATFERLPQLAVLATRTDEPADWLVAGEALEHVLLAATSHGVSASFLYQIIERDEMQDVERPRWPWPEHRQMVLRLGYGTPTIPVPRRDLDAVL